MHGAIDPREGHARWLARSATVGQERDQAHATYICNLSLHDLLATKDLFHHTLPKVENVSWWSWLTFHKQVCGIVLL